MGKSQPQISRTTRGLRMSLLVLGIGGAIKKMNIFESFGRHEQCSLNILNAALIAPVQTIGTVPTIAHSQGKRGELALFCHLRF